jgi:hypothetical protein
LSSPWGRVNLVEEAARWRDLQGLARSVAHLAGMKK